MRAALLFLVAVVYWREVICYLDAEINAEMDDVGIFGGHSIRIEEAPYMASLRAVNGTIHICGASIIHETFLLSAAHCCEPGESFKVVLGTDKINGSNGEIIDVKGTIPHPEYNFTDIDKYNYDFCVIELERPITVSSKVAKINLQENAKVLEGTKFNATGWGYTEDGTMPENLQQIEIPFVDSIRCGAIYEKNNISVTPEMICAGNRGHVSCNGDSGGPLTHNDVQYGVTSWGDCNEPVIVYARVSSVVEWIKGVIEKH